MIIIIAINISPLASQVYFYNISNAKYDINVYIYILIMGLSLIVSLLDIIGIKLFLNQIRKKYTSFYALSMFFAYNVIFIFYISFMRNN